MTRERPKTQRSHARSAARADGGQKEKRRKSTPVRLKSQSVVASSPSQNQTVPSVIFSSTGHLMEENRQDVLNIEEVGERWFRVRWSLTKKTLERADSAMGRESHRAVRVLRLFRVDQDDSGPRSKSFFQEVEVPADAREWFLHVPTVEHAWLVELGMVFGNGRFFSMMHSVPVTLNTSRVELQGTARLLGSHRLVDSMEGGDPPPLKVQGTFLLQGVTRPGAQASIDDQTVPVNEKTGQFEWQIPLPNGRMVVPVNVADSGKTQRALLAIDLNFHLLDPEPNEDL